MKKFLLLSLLFFVMLALVLSYIPTVIRASIQECRGIKLSYDLYAQTVSGSGQIENIGEYAVTSSIPVVIKDILVDKGEYVNAGDEVATIDVDETKNYIYSLSTQSAYSALLGDNNLTAVSNAIPEKLYSSKSGIVAEIDATVGEAVMGENPVMRIINNDTLIAVVSVNERDAQKLAIGQTASVNCKAITENVYTGTIENIAPTAHKKYTGTSAETVVDVSIRLDDTTLLKSGYTVNADITVSDSEVVAYIPYEVIMQDNESEYVYVVLDGKCVRKNIVTGRDLPNGEEIISGLDDEDIILTDTGLGISKAVKVKYGAN